MAEANLDHPGEISWFKGYGPSPVLGACEHDCPHNAQHGRVTSAWLRVQEADDRLQRVLRGADRV